LTRYSECGAKREGRGGANAFLLVSESGLYKLVLRSDKPEAKAFQEWVTREVRKDGTTCPAPGLG
jgi:prophage antirepressor-like protein